MGSITRYRVRAAQKDWTDAGPDLLRTSGHARKALAGVLGHQVEQEYATRWEKMDGLLSEWKPAASRKGCMTRFDRFAAGVEANRRGDFFFQVATKREGRDSWVLRVAVSAVDVDIPDLANCSPATKLVQGLVKAQFPNIKFSGGFVHKQVTGSSDWSDHAWGTALDNTENPPQPTNDETTDWCARMARAGDMDFDYLLGSRDDRVVQCSAPDFNIEPSGAASSHLWHVHISVVDNDGKKPPREGGVW